MTVIIKALHFRKYLRLCSLTIEINIVDFDNSAYLIHTQEVKKHVWVTEVLKDKTYAIRKKHMRDVYCKLGVKFRWGSRLSKVT